MKYLLTILFLASHFTLFSQWQTIDEVEDELKSIGPKMSEIESAKIKFRLRSRGSAMSASYVWYSVFLKPKNRRYFVNINTDVKGSYHCFQYNTLTDSSRIGVLAHELAHIQLFYSLSTAGMLKFIFSQASARGIDQNELDTDARVVKNGLGHFLLSWSAEVRRKYSEQNPNKSHIEDEFNERYMNPQRIREEMKKYPSFYKIIQ